MSVRAGYVRRGERGTVLKGLRLVGSRSDAAWPAPEGPPGAVFDAAARWIKDELAGTRTPDHLAALCLDADGGVFSWINSPSRDPAVVAAVARQADMDRSALGGGGASSPLDYFAPDQSESLIQPLAPSLNGHAKGLRLPRRRAGRANPAQESHRLALLAQLDTPARLLIDALDRAGVGVESVLSIWHAMVRAWDPGSRPATPGASERAVMDAAPPAIAVVLMDPDSRLVWAWGRAGGLLAGGAIRVRRGGDEAGWNADADDASRLVNDWLAWAAQLGEAPARVVCIVPPGEEESPAIAEFGRALAAGWTGASVDLVVNADPLGATLARLADVLEGAPAPVHTDASPDRVLVNLAMRRGRQHRALYLWSAAALVLAGATLAGWGYSVRRRAATISRAAAAGETAWRDKVKDLAPDLSLVRPGQDPLAILKSELDAREKRLRRPEKADPAMPVMQELETLSFILGNPDYTLEALSLDSRGLSKLQVVVPDIAQAEALLDALRSIAGSHMGEWRAKYQPRPDSSGGPSRVLADFTGTWARAPEENAP